MERVNASTSDRLRRQPDYYVGLDPKRPGQCAVWEVPPAGRHVVVADDFDRREDAERWINYQTATWVREQEER